ncbi:unnamed protein product [Ectocarpus sp. 12 AP-2014]
MIPPAVCVCAASIPVAVCAGGAVHATHGEWNGEGSPPLRDATVQSLLKRAGRRKRTTCTQQCTQQHSGSGDLCSRQQDEPNFAGEFATLLHALLESVVHSGASTAKRASYCM